MGMPNIEAGSIGGNNNAETGENYKSRGEHTKNRECFNESSSKSEVTRYSSRLDFLDDDDDEPAFASFTKPNKDKIKDVPQNISTTKQYATLKSPGGSIHSLFESSDEESVITPNISSVSTQSILYSDSKSALPVENSEKTLRNEIDEDVFNKDGPAIDFPPGTGFIDSDYATIEPDNIEVGGEQKAIQTTASTTVHSSDDKLTQEHSVAKEPHFSVTASQPHPSSTISSPLNEQVFSAATALPEKQQHSDNTQRMAYKENPTKLIQRISQSKTSYRPIMIALNGSVLVYRQATQQRYLNGVAMQKNVNIFAVEPVKIPKIDDIVIKDEAVKRLIDSKLTDRTAVSKIEEMLGITPSELALDDMVVGKSFMNEMLLTRGSLNCEDFCKTIIKNSVKNPFLAEALKAKLGIHPDKKNLRNVKASSGWLSTIIALNNPTLTRFYIESQENFLIYFVVFYKLNLVSIMEYASSLYNNLYYLRVLKQISKGEDLSLLGPEGEHRASEKSGWSFKSVIDFGISTILSVETDSERVNDPYGDLNISEAKKGDGLPGLVDATPHNMHSDVTDRFDKMRIENVGVPTAVQQGKHSEIINVTDQNEPYKASVSLDKIAITPEEKSELKSVFEDSDDEDIFNNFKKNEEEKTVEKATSEIEPPREGPLDKVNEQSIYGNEQAALSTENLSEGKQESIYKKKFSKSFADIFSLGSDKSAQKLDVSSYAEDVEENDKPMLIKNYEEESKSSFFNVFGMFKKKEKPIAQEASFVRRPPRAAIKIPETPKRPSIVKELYANKKSSAIEIPGAGAPSVKKHVLNPDRRRQPSPTMDEERDSTRSK